MKQKYGASLTSTGIQFYDRSDIFDPVMAINVDEAYSKINNHAALVSALEDAHTALHQCCAVLSSNDCEQVSSVMREVRNALKLANGE